ncbi:hypothetical protein HRbin39_01109 [bacterium HR39]|nr:hypothetical protein HRbin39_01109 [bacterium HR39]
MRYRYVLLTDHRGEWTAHETAWGFLVRSPFGEPLRVARSLEEAVEAAWRAKETYDEVDRLVQEYAPLSLEEEAERELEEEEDED